MNVYPSQITTSIAVSNRFSLEALEEIYEGIQLACKNYGVDLVGGDTTSSKTGLIISITAAGFGDKNRIVNRKGAKENDLLVVSGDLGGAYVGLQVLEREKAVFKVNPNTQPDLSKYSYCIEKQLKPEARKDVIKLLDELEVIPTSMIDISDGLSTEINHLSSASGLSFHIVEDQIPISDNTKTICEDYELLFTTSKKNLKKIQQSDYLSVIGTCVNKKNDNCMITSLGQKININSSGWDSFSVNN
jgi:thiamine-monophosphate kinase